MFTRFVCFIFLVVMTHGVLGKKGITPTTTVSSDTHQPTPNGFDSDTRQPTPSLITEQPTPSSRTLSPTPSDLEADTRQPTPFTMTREPTYPPAPTLAPTNPPKDVTSTPTQVQFSWTSQDTIITIAVGVSVAVAIILFLCIFYSGSGDYGASQLQGAAISETTPLRASS